MRSRQAHSSNQQNSVSPVPTTLWDQLPPTSQQQLASLVAQLIQRVRRAVKDQENNHEH